MQQNKKEQEVERPHRDAPTTGQPSTEMVIGGRVYEILGFLRGEEKSVKGDVMVERAKELNANLGKEDHEFLLNHQDQIPAELREKVAFVFSDWRNPVCPGLVAYVYWDGGLWIRHWGWLVNDWDDDGRLLRRK